LQAKGAEAKAAAKSKVYYINHICIGCQVCKMMCPASAVNFGDCRNEINQKKCIHCGTCFRECPFDNNGLRKDIEYEVSLDEAGVPGNRAKKANTFEELAKKMNVPVDKFVATMTRYNEYCEKGKDLDMAKDARYLKAFKKPPYYAFFLRNFANTTHGGLVINENMELVNAKDKTGIPNLFAAGDNAKAMEGGMRWCPASGYMAGIAAAKYLGFGPGLVRLT
jgi:ferredoxin